MTALSNLGSGYARLVLEGYYHRRLTLSDVSDHLNLKLNYIAKLEAAAYAGRRRWPRGPLLFQHVVAPGSVERTVPIDHFPMLWEHLAGLVAADRAIAPIEVRHEIQEERRRTIQMA